MPASNKLDRRIDKRTQEGLTRGKQARVTPEPDGGGVAVNGSLTRLNASRRSESWQTVISTNGWSQSRSVWRSSQGPSHVTAVLV